MVSYLAANTEQYTQPTITLIFQVHHTLGGVWVTGGSSVIFTLTVT